MRALTLCILLLLSLLGASRAAADDIVPSERVSSAVLVREGPSTDTAILGRLRPGDSARLVGEVSGWYRVELPDGTRSEEHTSELQSLMRISYAVFCLKKKKTKTRMTIQTTILLQHDRITK